MTLLLTQWLLPRTPALICLYSCCSCLTLLLAVPRVVTLVTFGLSSSCRPIRLKVSVPPLRISCRPSGLESFPIAAIIQALEFRCILMTFPSDSSPIVLWTASCFIWNPLVSVNLPGSPVFGLSGALRTQRQTRLLIRLVSSPPPKRENLSTVLLFPALFTG